MPKSSWVFGYTGKALGSSILFDGEYGHTFIYSAFTGAQTSFPLLIPEDMWNIDTKMDDGMPAIGKVSLWAKPTAKSLCTDAVGTTAVQAATLTANYVLTSTSKCALVFRNAF